jgi:non-lysosomal glucosylceramidase
MHRGSLLTRRQLLAAGPALGGALGASALLAGCGGGDVPAIGRRSLGQRNLQAHPTGLWQVPTAAWRRPLGSHPPGATGTYRSLDGLTPPESRTKRGVPLGGIGTGSFMLNLCGSFGPWHLDIGGDDSRGSLWGTLTNSGFEQRFLEGAAFHLVVDAPGAVASQDTSKTARAAGGSAHRASWRGTWTLATEDTLPAWPRLATGSGTYAALFPKAWFTYEGLLLPAALAVLTPFVANDERTSSLPLALFKMVVANPTPQPARASVMFSYPNAPYRMPTEQYDYPREGLRSSAVVAGDMAGIRLQAESPRNVLVTNRTEWAIAAMPPSGGVVTFSEDWAADGDGSDLIEAFARHGRLPNEPLDRRRRGLGGAVCVEMTLAPGERQVALFALAWDFPLVQFKNPVDGTVWRKRYTEWYPGGYRAIDIAFDGLEAVDSIEAGIDQWWGRIVESPAYPDWLKCAALNELYYEIFGGSFWENGCVSKPKRFGARPGQHLSFVLESDYYRDCDSLDVRHYAASPKRQLLPTVERDLLLGWADMVMADAEGRTPHDAGSPVNDPWFVPNQYWATFLDLPPQPVDWLDLPSKFVQQACAYWVATGDRAFLEEVYPAALRTMQHLASLDADGDGVPEAARPATTYDTVAMEGPSTYVAALFIGAAEALATMAGALGRDADQQAWQQAATRARQTAETVLWDPAMGAYRLAAKGADARALMADALCGQRYATYCGLPPVLDPERMASHLWQVHVRNVLPFVGGTMGAVNIVSADGRPMRSGGAEANGVWPGGSYMTAALMVELGKRTGQPELVDAGLALGRGVYETTYVRDDTAFWFDTPAVWLASEPTGYRTDAYQRCRAAWELLTAVSDPFSSGASSGLSA